ncbi:MAG TPA: serine/threonine-protein kinase [Kofleriaceae bacterium]|nr:serine/threonine-protein kinase [Kofleriaceae bacterium]
MIAPGLRIGRYELGERLGKGAFGIVHLARDVELGREIAIKFLRPEYLAKPQVVQRFLQEARAAARIDHPGIVTVYDCGMLDKIGLRVEGTAYIAMERLHGTSLAERLEAGGRMPVGEAIAIARQLAGALVAAHAAAIIHRDLKPENIYLLPDPAVIGGQRVKILDFGVAKLAEGGEPGVHTHSQIMLGTPRYMSPEQARSAAHVDHRADIYALGCIVYELVCGRPPFTGEIADVIHKHQSVEPVPPCVMIPTLPPTLDALIMHMLAKDPDRRPQAMADVDRALAAIDLVVASTQPAIATIETTDKVDPAGRSTTGARRRPWWRRTPSTLALVTAAATLGVVGVVWIECGSHAPALTANTASPAEPAADDPAPAVPLAAERTDTEASAARATTASDDGDLLRTECKALVVDRKWPAVLECARQLERFDATMARELRERSQLEAIAEAELRRLTERIDHHALVDAKQALDRISTSSVYRHDAEQRYAAAELAAKQKLVVKAAVAPPPCAVDDSTQRGNEAFASGMYTAALAAYQDALRCSPDPQLTAKAYVAACSANDAGVARELFAKLPEGRRPVLSQVCLRHGIDPAAADD